MSKDTTEINVGSIAPDFGLESHEGKMIHLSDYRERKHVVLYFMREFAWLQCRGNAAQLGRLYEQLQAQDTEVLVIGPGKRKDAERLSKTFKLPFPVLADTDRTIYRRYDLNKVLIAIQRSGTFLIDKQGILRYIHQVTNPQAGVNKAELLQEVMNLQTRKG